MINIRSIVCDQNCDLDYDINKPCIDYFSDNQLSINDKFLVRYNRLSYSTSRFYYNTFPLEVTKFVSILQNLSSTFNRFGIVQNNS